MSTLRDGGGSHTEGIRRSRRRRRFGLTISCGFGLVVFQWCGQKASAFPDEHKYIRITHTHTYKTPYTNRNAFAFQTNCALFLAPYHLECFSPVNP